MNKKFKKIIGTLLIILGATLIFSAFPPEPLLSPLPLNFPKLPFLKNKPTKPKIVFGFLPYWNFKFEPHIQYQTLTHLAFFGLEVNPDGTLNTKEPGWNAYKSPSFGTIIRKTHAADKNVVLVLRAFDNQTIESVLSNKNRVEKLITETMEILKQKNLDGINIDFEYVGSPPAKIRHQFTDFISLLHSTLLRQPADQFSTFHLSIDAYADAAQNYRLWDIEKLAPHIDQIIVMAYDYTRPSSEYSGPVAPLDQIKESIAAYAKLLPVDKIILGVPFYGYEWPTYSQEPISKTKDSGYLATYQRIQELIENAVAKVGWDLKSFTPYLISTDSGKTTQIFYDDLQSLSLKYDFVNESDLAGIAIWAIGYEGDNNELWQLIQKKFY